MQERAVQVPLVTHNSAEIYVRRAKEWIEPKSFLELGSREVDMLLAIKSEPEIAVVFCVFWLFFNCGAKILSCLFKLFLAKIERSASGKDRGLVGTGHGSLIEEFESSLVVSKIRANRRQENIGPKIMWQPLVP